MLLLILILFVDTRGSAQYPSGNTTSHSYNLDKTQAIHFADLALSCMHKHYPNKLNQVLWDSSHLKAPKELHPAFYGCFDWHSSVHGHWMLIRLLKMHPDLPRRSEIEEKLEKSLNTENIAGEMEYFKTASPSWERTYGWAWLLKLAEELNSWDDPLGMELFEVIKPLAAVIRDRYIEFIPKQDYAIRTGVHPNTAFGISFAIDYAREVKDDELLEALREASFRYYLEDEDCPIGWEPGGADFLSPCLEEAALMARVMEGDVYREWLEKFLPELSENEILPAIVSDRSDPQIVHLDGLNLSRAWNLLTIAGAVSDHRFREHLRTIAKDHLNASLPYVVDQYYEGSHWLGSFAVYALSKLD
jgi:hypothetical protein